MHKPKITALVVTAFLMGVVLANSYIDMRYDLSEKPKLKPHLKSY